MVETNITLETFENIVISLLKEKGYDTEIVTWSGTRGPEHRLVRKKVKKAGSKLRVTASVKIEFIYNHYMEMLSKGKPPLLDDVVDSIISDLESELPAELNDIADKIHSWDWVKDRLILSLYNTELHKEYLKDKIYDTIDDLAITPRICVNVSNNGIASTLIDYHMLKDWGVAREEYNNDYYAYLKDEAWKGFEERYPLGHVRREIAKDRLNYELGIVKEMGFAQYFLDIRKTIVHSKDNGILVGPGRGSGVGSCMNYCLRITDLDPLQYDLLFERFLNPERISMPDIDTDFEYLRKDDVIAAEADDYGHDCFAKIETFGTMQAKNVLKGCAKVSGIENHVAVGNKLAKFINENHDLKTEWGMNPELQIYVHSDPRLEKIWEIALKLEGVKKSAGTHACGHIPTPIPCEQLFPCRVDSESGLLVCEYDMNQAEHLGNLKKDLLMLRNLTIIDAAQREIKRRTGKQIPLWTKEILNDKKALKMISDGDTNGVFQLESDGMKKFMRQLQPDCFEDIIAGVALYRPGPMDYIPDYIRNKHNPKGIVYDTPELKPILESTYGIIVYQEEVMLIVQKLAGFSMGRADLVRKAMSKKKQELMDQEAPHFVYGDKNLNIEGCAGKGISENVAKKIWDRMVDFAKYAFNKSHAAAYAAISMQTAFLKAHYPLEFAMGLLTSVMDNSDKLMKYHGSLIFTGASLCCYAISKKNT